MKDLVIGIVLTAVTTGLVSNYLGHQSGVLKERTSGQAVQERAAAIDACAREANVYPESCAMKAVVVSPTMPPADKTAALLPPPVEGV